jgi:hypothetical protein
MPEILIFVICIASYIFGVISLVQERKYLRGILALISGIILSIWFSLALYVSILRSNTTTYPIVDIVDPRTGLTTQYYKILIKQCHHKVSSRKLEKSKHLKEKI